MSNDYVNDEICEELTKMQKLIDLTSETVNLLNNVLSDIRENTPERLSFAIRNVSVALDALKEQPVKSANVKKAVKELKAAWLAHTVGNNEGERWNNTKFTFRGNRSGLWESVAKAIRFLGGEVNPRLYEPRNRA